MKKTVSIIIVMIISLVAISCNKGSGNMGKAEEIAAKVIKLMDDTTAILKTIKTADDAAAKQAELTKLQKEIEGIGSEMEKLKLTESEEKTFKEKWEQKINKSKEEMLKETTAMTARTSGGSNQSNQNQE